MKKLTRHFLLDFDSAEMQSEFESLLDGETGEEIAAIFASVLDRHFPGVVVRRMDSSIPLEGLGADVTSRLVLRIGDQYYDLRGKGNTRAAALVSAVTGGGRVVQNEPGPAPPDVGF